MDWQQTRWIDPLYSVWVWVWGSPTTTTLPSPGTLSRRITCELSLKQTVCVTQARVMRAANANAAVAAYEARAAERRKAQVCCARRGCP